MERSGNADARRMPTERPGRAHRRRGIRADPARLIAGPGTRVLRAAARLRGKPRLAARAAGSHCNAEHWTVAVGRQRRSAGTAAGGGYTTLSREASRKE